MQRQKRKFGDDSLDPCKELDFFSDAVLRTEDGNKFRISRSLLARHCPFFKALFFGGFGDGTDVLLKGIDAETLGSILLYLYTGTIHLNEENATNILVASDYLLIDSLVQESRSFVLREMSPANCVPVFLAAWRIESLGILNNCHRFIVIHFEEVVSQSEEIGSLPLEALKTFLIEKSLNVSDEITVWNVIIRWIKFNIPDRLQLVPELLRYISVEDADEPLMNVIHMISKNKPGQELILGELQYSGHLQNFRQILKSQSIMTGSRIPTEVHLIIHFAHDGFDKNIYLTSDGEIDYWQKVGSIGFFPKYLIQLDRYVYMFDPWIPMSLAFDMFDGECLPMTPINGKRGVYSVVSVNGFIYVMGGFHGFLKCAAEIERFDPRTGKWKVVSNMVPMTHCRAVPVNGYIYAIGFESDVTNANLMVQVYDPASDNCWIVNKRRDRFPVSAPRHFAAIAFRGHLYLIRGKTCGSVQKNMEEYDPLKNVWISMPDLPVAYGVPSAIVLKDVLIVYEDSVTARMRGESYSCPPPVCWDSESRTWHIIEDSSPLRKIHLCKFCTITEPNVVKGIVKRNRQRSKRWVKSPLA